MSDFLVCSSSYCRFVIDLQEARKPLSGSFLKQCPECGSSWSASCPFCAEPVSVTWRGHHALCAHCHRQFHTLAAA
jgi:transcription elongation factor Elf1